MITTSVSIFDVIGPVMVGPSSSHTAGAARLGNLARAICGQDFKRVEFHLHGSFARTYKGHGTARALLGGILGLSPDNEGIRDSYQWAVKQGIDYEFFSVDLGDVHPNTVKIIVFTDEGEKCEVIGSSVGGGNVLITSINGLGVEFTGRYPTIITSHSDQPGIVAQVTSLLSDHKINIAFLKVFRQSRGSEACMVIETDQQVARETMQELSGIPFIKGIISIDSPG